MKGLVPSIVMMLSRDELTVKGERKKFYSPEKVLVAYNEHQFDLHTWIHLKA
jgi:hypothetical protein